MTNTVKTAYNNYSNIVQEMDTMHCVKADVALDELKQLFVETLTEAQKKRFVDSDLIEQLDYIECSF